MNNAQTTDPLSVAVPGKDEFVDRLRALLAKSADEYVRNFQNEIVRFCNAATGNVTDIRLRSLCLNLAPYLLYCHIQMERDEPAEPWPVAMDLDRAAERAFSEKILDAFEQMAGVVFVGLLAFIKSARKNIIVPMVGTDDQIATAALVGALLRAVGQ